VPTLPTTIRNIRKRLNQTMTEFAESLGTDQSTISRYESGQVVPSKTVLILLFLLASGTEREPILEAMGEVSDASLLSRYKGADEALKRLPKPTDTSRVQFAEESAAMIASKEPIEPALVQLLKLCRSHAGNRKLRQAVVQMLPYFEFVAGEKQ
jgi:transcriptional regulator with XRE-family HTH domain